MKSQTLKKNSQDGHSFVGVVTLTTFPLTCERAHEIDSELKDAHGIAPERYEELVAELNALCPARKVVKHNIVVLAGRAVFARLLAGDTTYSGAVNYGALGTDNTAPNSADTALGTEVARKLFARRSRTNAQVNFDFYYSKSDTDGTYEEFGMFIDGTATADSGVLFNRVLTGGWTKTDQEAMTVQVQININQS